MASGTIEIFKEIPDPRSGNALKYKLEEILTIAVLAVLCDCSQFTEMELFGIEQEEWLKTFLSLEHGIPSHDTLLLKMLELSGCIVTIDAMGTQKEIAKEIREAKADYVLVVKENQAGLHADLSLFFSTEKEDCDCAKTTKSRMVVWKRPGDSK